MKRQLSKLEKVGLLTLQQGAAEAKQAFFSALAELGFPDPARVKSDPADAFMLTDEESDAQPSSTDQ